MALSAELRNDWAMKFEFKGSPEPIDSHQLAQALFCALFQLKMEGEPASGAGGAKAVQKAQASAAAAVRAALPNVKWQVTITTF